MTLRLFVAVWPPPDVVRTLAAMPRPEVPGLRWTTEEQWHVTLRFLGDAPLDAARSAFASIDARPATAVLGPAVSSFGRHVLHVPVAGVDDLARAALAATRTVGDPPEDRPFTGHLTLARAPRRGPKVDLTPFVGRPVEGEWRVDELTLVSSTTDPRGALYEVVDRLPLA